MKDAFYFPHDSNASQDPKIIQMCSVYKSEGYGWYWMLVEMMREQEGYRLYIGGKYSINAFAMRMYADIDAFAQYLSDCVEEFQLFASDGDYIWSDSLIRRMEKVDQKSEKARQAAKERWSKSGVNSDNLCERNANASKSDAIKEIKRKEIKINNTLTGIDIMSGNPSESDQPTEDATPSPDGDQTADGQSEKQVRLSESVKTIIEHLNATCRTDYKASTKKTQGLIKARLNEGFTVDDFIVVVNKKSAEWLNDAKFSQYLRPETLFGTKFEGYLNQRSRAAPQDSNDSALDLIAELEREEADRHGY